MDHQIFLSYPVLDQDLVENFADRLLQNGVKAWVYSIDKTLSAETWDGLKTRIAIAELFAFAASVNSRDSSGQHRELQMAIEKVTQDPGNRNRLLPIMIDDLPFSELPPLLNRVNGVRLNAYNVASTAKKVAGEFFPNLLNDVRDEPWKCPKPGQWLEVCSITPEIKRHLEHKDLLYFRRLSPLGLFECYSPKLKGLFWIMPEHVRACGISQNKCPPVPEEFHYMTSVRHEMLGLQSSVARS